jgi:hypothetical protein
MSNRRTPPIYVAGVRAGDRSQDVDGAYFTHHPHTTEYTRAYIAGETPEPLPVGTKVIVKRHGATRMRAFVLPEEGLN